MFVRLLSIPALSGKSGVKGFELFFPSPPWDQGANPQTNSSNNKVGWWGGGPGDLPQMQLCAEGSWKMSKAFSVLGPGRVKFIVFSRTMRPGMGYY